MDEVMGFLLRHGDSILFFVVLAEQLGLPIPAAPILLAVGALAGSGKTSFVLATLVAISGSLASDFIWYELGRRRGRSVLRLVCRISLAPDFCVRRTENVFARYGPGVLVLGKFIPGLNIAAPPLVAIFRMPLARFLVWDGAGAFIWSFAYISIGYLFRRQLEQAGAFAVHLGLTSFAVLAVALAVFIGWKYLQRRRFLRRLRIARITPAELLGKLERGEDIVVVDLRHPLDFQANHTKIPGALRLLPEELDARHLEIPRDRDVALYCNCPNEATSARVALQLRRFGITRVRPLAGGFEAWRGGGFPLELAEAEPQAV